MGLESRCVFSATAGFVSCLIPGSVAVTKDMCGVGVEEAETWLWFCVGDCREQLHIQQFWVFVVFL